MKNKKGRINFLPFLYYTLKTYYLILFNTILYLFFVVIWVTIVIEIYYLIQFYII